MTFKNGIMAGTALGLLMMAPSFVAPTVAQTQRLSGSLQRAEDAAMLLAQASGQDVREELEKRRQEQAKQQDGKKSELERGAEGARQPEQQPEAESPQRQQPPQSAGDEESGDRPAGGGAAQRGDSGVSQQPAAQEGDQAREAKPTEEPPAGEPEPERAEPPSQGAETQGQPEGTKRPNAEPTAQTEKRRAQPVQEDGEAPEQVGDDQQGEGAADEAAKPSEKGDSAQETQQKRGGEDAAAGENVGEADVPAKNKDGAAKQREADERREDRDAEREKSAEQPDSRANRRSDAQAQRGEPLPENAAPVLDSQKRQAGEDGQRRERARDDERRQRDEDVRGAEGRDRDERRERERARDMPLPDSDRAAQRDMDLEEVQSLTAEEGKRIDRSAWRERQRRDRHDGARVLKEFGDRFVLQFNDRTFVQSSDQDRLRYRSRDVYYEELPRDRTREVIVRDNGFKVVTIRGRYGDIIRRSRITPDGSEYVLVYADDRGRHGRDRGEWRDPGHDLPPLHLTIPVSEYILEAERVEDPDVYYRFLEEPPVEPVERLYSLDDVKYSARIRDKVRRIDLDTINFEFGSASIGEGEVDDLEAVADAMVRLLDENPAETFLIEGHTDAVGSDVSNLALSDERASSVASTLTDVFGIPPENLVPQGYGEQYLKIETQERERENRRVAIRRITPLVRPVASAQ